MADDGYSALMADADLHRPGGPRPVQFDTLPAGGLDAHDLTGLAIGIVYRKSPRDVSRRWITLRSVDAPDFSAYCWLRRAFKTFRLDRIQDVYDRDGVTMEPAAFFARFGVTVAPAIAPPAESPTRISVTLPAGLLARVEAVADNRNDWIVTAIGDALARAG